METPAPDLVAEQRIPILIAIDHFLRTKESKLRDVYRRSRDLLKGPPVDESLPPRKKVSGQRQRSTSLVLWRTVPVTTNSCRKSRLRTPLISVRNGKTRLQRTSTIWPSFVPSSSTVRGQASQPSTLAMDCAVQWDGKTGTALKRRSNGIVNLSRLREIVTWNAGACGVAQATVTVRQTAKDCDRNSR
jgi:hypothetical protein